MTATMSFDTKSPSPSAATKFPADACNEFEGAYLLGQRHAAAGTKPSCPHFDRTLCALYALGYETTTPTSRGEDA